MHQVIVDQVGVDTVLHRLHNVEACHEFLNAVQLFRRDGFICEAKVMMCAVGDAIAHDFAGFVAIFAHAEHTRSN